MKKMENHNNPEINWKKINGKEYLHFTFVGKFNYPDALIGIESWKQAFKKKNKKKLSLIFNCKEMTGWQPLSRQVWQRTILELKSQISDIWIITDSSSIKAGAGLIGLFTSMNLHVIRSEKELP